MYQERTIQKHYAGFGMWQQSTEGSELFENDYDIIHADADNGYDLVALGTPEADAIGAEDIRGRIYNQRGTIYAYRLPSREWYPDYYDGSIDTIGYMAIVEVNARSEVQS